MFKIKLCSEVQRPMLNATYDPCAACRSKNVSDNKSIATCCYLLVHVKFRAESAQSVVGQCTAIDGRH